MLTQLTISNFAIADSLIVEYQKGMTAITGETGAGKSISIDALHFCLGGKVDSSIIREGSDRADVSAQFCLDDTPSALKWLQSMQLDEDNECIIRRTINQDNRSKAFINGRAATLSQLKELGRHLIHIHGQHEHQRLLELPYQQKLLDQYIDDPALFQKMKSIYQRWKEAEKEHQTLQKRQQEQLAHYQLLQYQSKELDEFAPIEGEFETIEEEYKKLANNESLIQFNQTLLTLLDDDSEITLLSQLNQAKHLTQDILQIDPSFKTIHQMIEEATLQIKEASYEVKHYLEQLNIDPIQLEALNQRISKQINLARKHRIKPEELPQFHRDLLSEITQMDNTELHSEALLLQIEAYKKEMMTIAESVHQSRVRSAKELSREITKSIKELSMPHAEFEIEVNWDADHINDKGADTVLFKVNTNPGQSLQPINKVASGGELSRIGLAIQVLTAKKIEMPALIFDEIDVGISGSTAAKVGQLLRRLGQSTQVITVTHLPQVASYADQQYKVDKKVHNKITKTIIQKLSEKCRINELARLLGGEMITQVTIANAEELLLRSQK